MNSNCSPEDIRERIETALQLHRTGQLQEALSGYEELAKIVPDHAVLLRLLAICHSDLCNHEQAFNYIGRALSLVCSIEMFLEAANIFERAGRCKEFLHSFTPTLLAANASAELYKIMLQLRHGPAAHAIELLLERAIELTPNCVELYGLYAETLFSNGKYSTATQVYRDKLHASQRGSSESEIILGNLLSVKNYCVMNPSRSRYHCIKAECACEQERVVFWREEKTYAPLIDITPECYVAEIEDVDFLGGFNPIFDNQGNIIYDLACHRLADRYDYKMSNPFIKLYDRCKMLMDVPSERHIKAEIDYGILFTGLSIECWGHWVLEYIPMFWCLEQCPEYDSVPLLVDERVLSDSHLSKMLQVLNKPVRPVIEISYKQRYRCKRLVIPSRLNHIPHDLKVNIEAEPQDLVTSVTSIHFIQKKFNSCSQPTSCKMHRLFIRRKSNFRRMVNESDVYELFKAFGFVAVAPDELSYEEKLDLFANTEAIAGSSGSFALNFMFLPAACKYITFGNKSGRRMGAFPLIAKTLGLSYYNVACSSIEGSSSLRHQLDFEADLGVVEKLLGEVFQR